MTYRKITKNDLVYPELSYGVVGALFEAFNKLGFGYEEKFYQKAIAEIFLEQEIPFKKEQKIEIVLPAGGKMIVFLDFLIEDKIILEIKRGERFLKKNIRTSSRYRGRLILSEIIRLRRRLI